MYMTYIHVVCSFFVFLDWFWFTYLLTFYILHFFIFLHFTFLITFYFYILHFTFFTCTTCTCAVPHGLARDCVCKTREKRRSSASRISTCSLARCRSPQLVSLVSTTLDAPHASVHSPAQNPESCRSDVTNAHMAAAFYDSDEICFVPLGGCSG